MKDLKFIRCKATGNVLEVVYTAKEADAPEGFDILKANTTDAANEKHVPVIETEGQKVIVKVGSVPHPMTEEHLVGFIVLHTDKRVLRVDLTPSDAPEATFVLEDGEKAIAAYEYCNLHGLWKAQA